MRSHFIQAAFGALFFIVSCSSLKTTPETIEELTQKIQAKDYTISVRYANPLRGKQIYLSSEYDLRIKNDSAFAYLPYFGVAYSAPYGGGEGGIKFAEPIIGYSMKPNKKSDGWDIHFRINAKESDYEISMNIFQNGSTIFTVSSFNRDIITFRGEVKK
ncbi:MAG: DUF4251 domain-containing protein [Bacteroidota bacterium]|nr:DUF4251 domain-containing protein [Bacteroidota bacterium]